MGEEDLISERAMPSRVPPAQEQNRQDSNQPSINTIPEKTIPGESSSNEAVQETELEKAIESLQLDHEEDNRMFRALAASIQRAKKDDDTINLDVVDGRSIWPVLQGADGLEQQGGRDVSALEAVKLVLEQMLAKHSDSCILVAKVLADASRERKIVIGAYSWTIRADNYQRRGGSL
jgi:ribosomal protein L18E